MLFDNNGFNDQDMLDLSFFNIDISKIGEDSNKLYDKKEGFLRGNMFKKEYLPYRNYKYAKIEPKTRAEEITLKLYELDFTINDLNLYLDIHPQDKEMFDLYKKYIREYDEVKKEYIRVVGPLCLTDVTSSYNEWLDKWPWEGDKK